MTTARTERPLQEEVLVRLARAAHMAGRPGIVLGDSDLAAVDDLTGSRARSHRLVERLEREARLRRIRRGAYVVVSETGTIAANVLDLVGAVSPQPHLVTAGRALQFHDLTDQHFRVILVLVARPARSWEFQGDRVRYVRTTSHRLRGSKRTRRTLASVATPARAILDSLAHPGWGVTVTQVAEALDLAIGRDDQFVDLLASETARYNNARLARRVGFLVSRIADPELARPFRPLRGTSKAIVPLVPGAPEAGPIDTTWRVRENVSSDGLVQHRAVM